AFSMPVWELMQRSGVADGGTVTATARPAAISALALDRFVGEPLELGRKWMPISRCAIIKPAVFISGEIHHWLPPRPPKRARLSRPDGRTRRLHDTAGATPAIFAGVGFWRCVTRRGSCKCPVPGCRLCARGRCQHL